MSLEFKIVPHENIHSVIPLVERLNEYKISRAILEKRFSDMVNENYECAGVFLNNMLIGVCGLWFCTRHYAGFTMEIDHVYVEEDYRNQGIGKEFLSWIESYAKSKNCNTIELNTYVQNYPSHKFYYNEGYEILGYHFLKKLN